MRTGLKAYYYEHRLTTLGKMESFSLRICKPEGTTMAVCRIEENAKCIVQSLNDKLAKEHQEIAL